MDIGKPQRTIHIEPIETPIPQRETKPARRERPAPSRKEPAKTPDKTPVKVPEKV
jgi:hypothetical protein